jgi:hypothetical protein
MSTKILTCIYSDLSGTEFGGRHARGGHYRWSLLSLLKITDADFLCYTSDREIAGLEDFFYVQHNVSREKIKFEIFDISQTKFYNVINQYKDIEGTKRGDRCVEIQYSKFHWWWNEDKSYDYYYWIDAGLSHTGLIPNKYLVGTHPEQRYYESTLFNNDFLGNVIQDTGDKFLMLAKENVNYYWSGTVNRNWYTNLYDPSLHVIGGMFGGHKSKWDNIVNKFEDYLEKIILTDKGLPHEENIMSLMRVNHPELFEIKQFDIWWCPDSGPRDLDVSYYEDKKSFYRILEEFNRIYE